jgi:hypothetical protein
LTACGGVQFERAAGVRKYRALPPETSVTVAETSDLLAQPVEKVGVLKVTTRGAEVGEQESLALLKKHAARYGCDAIVEVKSNRRESKTVKKVKKLGPDGVPFFEEQTTSSVEVDWQASCIRTAEAPPEPAPRVAGQVAARPPEEQPAEPKPAKALRARKPRPAEPPPDSSEAKPEETKPVARPKPPVTRPPAEPDPDPEGSAEKPPVEKPPVEKPRPRPVEEQPPAEPAAPPPKPPAMVKPPEPPKPETPPPPELPPLPAEDKALASEVARSFLKLSRELAAGRGESLCSMLDSEKVYLDIRTNAPRMTIRKEMSGEEACTSFKEGELAGYVREFGPAEVHAEVATLLPTLFKIHGGAYLQLDPEREKAYPQRVAEDRQGKKPLACTLYSVLPAGNLFKISLSCGGVQSYRVLLRRDGTDDYKLMAFTHLR